MFQSSTTKTQSLRLLDKLTSGLQRKDDTKDKKKSSTELLNSQFGQPASTKKVIKKRNKVLQKKQEQDSKELKRIKYEIIKAKKDSDKLTPEHAKYLQKLIRKNKNLLLNDDEFDNVEVETLQEDILNFSAKKKTKRDKKTFKTKKNFPGLTPGLAPVDYESDDE